ncbi:MAG TPA: hypothetical protein VGS07_23375 [Thermoanaerobaculia bacterium]|jgi:hypothetical protein|nr:hypothetical protein [Thermoanaerobaculia bacterium]
MKNQRIVLWILIALTVPLAVAGCRARTDRSEGTVVLSVSHFNGLPFTASLTTQSPPYVISTVTLSNFAKDPGGTTSSLQDIELRSYEVTYRRRDTGTRVPPPSVQGLFGNVPVNGTTDLVNTGFLFSDQTLSQPLKDLHDFGVDRETGTSVIVLDVTMTFFGRTLSGDDVASAPATFTLEVRH